jgi:hypothetical protein
MRLSVGALFSSVAVCVACMVVTATAALREIATDVLISGSANVGSSRSGLVSCLLFSLSKVGLSRSDAVCGSGGCRCGRGIEPFVREISTGYLGGRYEVGSTPR